MSKLARICVPAALACAAVLIGAAAAPAHADGLPIVNLNALATNALVNNGVRAAGQSALESLNGVAVEAVVLPPEARR